MSFLTPYAQRRLMYAMTASFDKPVTGYMVNARFESCCCIGTIFHHQASRADGWLYDGHRIRTSDVIRLERSNELWTFITHSGSHYVIVTFEQRTGRTSLSKFLKILARGFHITARAIQ